MALLIDENATRAILEKRKIVDCDPRKLAAQINRACKAYRWAKSKEKPIYISKIGPKLTGVVSTAKALSNQIAKLNTSGITALLSPWIRVQDQKLMEHFTNLQAELDRLQELMRFAESRVLKEIKSRSKPIKISIARQHFFGRLLAIFDQIRSGDGALQGFSPPSSNEGKFFHDDAVAFVVEVVQRFPLIRDEILGAAARRKKPSTRLHIETDQLYQAVAWNIARLIRGLNLRQLAQQPT